MDQMDEQMVKRILLMPDNPRAIQKLIEWESRQPIKKIRKHRTQTTKPLNYNAGWMTMLEAQEYSRFGYKKIRALIESGAVVGKKSSGDLGRWRILKDSLYQYLAADTEIETIIKKIDRRR